MISNNFVFVKANGKTILFLLKKNGKTNCVINLLKNFVVHMTTLADKLASTFDCQEVTTLDNKIMTIQVVKTMTILVDRLMTIL